MSKFIKFFCFSSLLISSLALIADTYQNLEKLPRPWKRPENASLSIDKEKYGSWRQVARNKKMMPQEYDKIMYYWAKEYPFCSLEKVAVSWKGDLPIYLLKVSDPKVPDTNKTNVLITSFHTGTEHSGGLSALRFIEYMLSENKDAVNFRKNYTLLFMPILNPYGYFKKYGAICNGVEIYTGNRGSAWDIDALKLKKDVPELKAFIHVVDKYQPEIHIDLHGIDMTQKGRTMHGSSGSATSNYALRPWDSRITDYMDREANKQNYGTIKLERDAQQLFYIPDAKKHRTKMWGGVNLFYSTMYGYFKYHTMPMVLEVGYIPSALARLKGLLDSGLNPPSDVIGRFPVDTVYSSALNFRVSAYGQNEAMRRRSRVELWRLNDMILNANLYPQYRGRIMTFFFVGKQGVDKLFIKKKPSFLFRYRNENLFEGRQDTSSYKWSEIRKFLQLGPENLIFFDKNNFNIPQCPEIKNGLAFKLLVPHPKAKMLEVRLNGFELKENNVDGYSKLVTENGILIIVNVPPSKANEQLYIVSIAYDSMNKIEGSWHPSQIKENKK